MLENFSSAEAGERYCMERHDGKPFIFFCVVKYLEAIERELQSPPRYPRFPICFADSTVNILNCFPSRLGTLVEALPKSRESRAQQQWECALKKRLTQRRGLGSGLGEWGLFACLAF